MLDGNQRMAMMEDSHRKAVSQTISHLAARWADADKRILRQVFPLLAKGQPVSVGRIAEAAGTEAPIVEAALEHGRAGQDVVGQVIALSGLMLAPTMHRVEIGEVALFSCCALLAQLVPALIGRPVTVESIDPVSRRVVRLAIAARTVTAVQPRQAVATLVVTEPRGVAEDVGASFCCHVHHFVSSDSASVFAAADRRRYVLGIGELHEAAQSLYREAWAE